MKTIYRSKVDSWLVVVLVIGMLISVGASISVFLAGGLAYWWVVALALVIAAFPAWILLSTKYTLDDELLLVQSGPLKWRVPVAEISRITPTHNPLSSPALSLDRLRIDYGNGKAIMISPLEKEQFIADLEAKLGHKV